MPASVYNNKFSILRLFPFNIHILYLSQLGFVKSFLKKD